MAKSQSKDFSTNVDLYGANVKLWIEYQGKMVPFRSIVGNASDFIESINIRIGLMEIFQVEVKMSPPLKETQVLLNSGKIGLGFTATKSNSSKKAKSVGDESSKQDKEYHLNKMAVQVEYGGLKSPIFKAILLMPEISISESGIDVTMKGVGMLFEQTKKSVLIKNEISEYDAVVKLLSANDAITLQFDKKAEEELKKNIYKPGDTKKAFEQAKIILSSRGCKMHYRGSDTIDGKQIVEIIHTDTMRKDVKNKFVAFKDIDPNRRIFPILSMSAPVSNIVASGAFLGAKNAVFDKSSKKVSNDDIGSDSYSKDVSSIIPSQDGSMTGGSGSSVKNEYGESSGFDGDDIVGNIMGAVSKDGSLLDNVKGVMHDWMEKVFKYDVTSVLIPDLLPARMIDINIADIKPLSNSYDLVTVEHNISQSGLETIIHCAGMGGLTSLVGQGANKAAGASIDFAASTGIVKKIKKTPKPVDIE